MDSEVICNPKKKHTLTDSLNNIGLRDASASKNGQYFRGFYPPQKAFFPTPGSSLSFTKIVATLQKLRLLSNSRVAYDHRTQLKSFTKIAATLQKLRLLRIYTPPYRGSPPPTQQMNIRNKNQLGWATN